MTISIERTYCVVSVKDITQTMIDEAITSVNRIRYSIDVSQAILEFESRFPISMAGYTKYTHTEILELLETETWKPI